MHSGHGGSGFLATVCSTQSLRLDLAGRLLTELLMSAPAESENCECCHREKLGHIALDYDFSLTNYCGKFRQGEDLCWQRRAGDVPSER